MRDWDQRTVKNDVFRQAKIRELRKKDPRYIRCVKDTHGKVLVEEEVKERRKNYFILSSTIEES